MSTKTVKNSRTAGKVYTVVGVQNNPHGEDEILFVNDRGVLLHFPISEYKDSFVPFDYDNTSDIFNNLNESEDGWVEDIVNQEEFRYGDILPYLDDGDIISITGDFSDGEGKVLTSVKNTAFRVKTNFQLDQRKINHSESSKKILDLCWVDSEDKRPENWGEITNKYDTVLMHPDTHEQDKDLMVKILHKEKL